MYLFAGWTRGHGTGSPSESCVQVYGSNIDSIPYTTAIQYLLSFTMCDSYWGFNDFLQSPFCELPQPVPNYFDTPDLAPIEPDDIPPSDEPFQFEPVVYHSYRNPPPCLQTCSSSGIIPDTTGPLPHTYVERTHVYPPIIQSDITLRPLACIPTHDPQTRVFPCPYFGHDRRKFAACEKIKYKAVSHIR